MCLALAAAWLVGSGWCRADDESHAIRGAQSLAVALEEDGFYFRAEPWVSEITPQLGKAVRVQLFKGNDYRFCVAVPRDSGVKITATVLDFEGKAGGDLRPLEEGWGLVLEYRPRKTGVYVVAVRELEGSPAKATPCAILVGYE